VCEVKGPPCEVLNNVAVEWDAIYIAIAAALEGSPLVILLLGREALIQQSVDQLIQIGVPLRQEGLRTRVLCLVRRCGYMPVVAIGLGPRACPLSPQRQIVCTDVVNYAYRV
jgi:hypothetical protein